MQNLYRTNKNNKLYTNENNCSVKHYFWRTMFEPTLKAFIHIQHQIFPTIFLIFLFSKDVWKYWSVYFAPKNETYQQAVIIQLNWNDELSTWLTRYTVSCHWCCFIYDTTLPPNYGILLHLKIVDKTCIVNTGGCKWKKN